MNAVSRALSYISPKPIGFAAHEVMEGWHQFEADQGPQGRLPLTFHLDWGTSNLRNWVDRSSTAFMTSEASGWIDAEGLGHHLPCQGTLTLHYLDEHLLRYSLDFKALERNLRLVGEKVNIQAWNLPVSHTTCFTRIVEPTSGRLVSTGVTHFRFRSAPAFLASFRLVKAGETT